MDKYLAHILVVDDDDRIRELVKQYLLEESMVYQQIQNLLLQSHTERIFQTK